jgi:hypothetical protein
LEPRLQLNKRRQFFIGTHNETFSISMCVSNPDRSTARSNHRNTAPTPAAFADDRNGWECPMKAQQFLCLVSLCWGLAALRRKLSC